MSESIVTNNQECLSSKIDSFVINPTMEDIIENELKIYEEENFTFDDALELLCNSLQQTSKSIESLRSYVLKKLQNAEVDRESIHILHYLIDINRLGLITFDSQPADSMLVFSDGTFWNKRAYLNGLFPRQSVAKLATLLFSLNNKIVVSETVLQNDPAKDYLNIFNFTRDSVPLIQGLYPMSKWTNPDTTVQWHEGYSGNINHPMSRKYIVDHSFILSRELIREIPGNYSLIQIWSQNISDNIFPTISAALLGI